MGFDPDAYGNPKAKAGTISAWDDRYQIDPDPGWCLPVQKRTMQQPLWSAEKSAQNEARTNSAEKSKDQISLPQRSCTSDYKSKCQPGAPTSTSEVQDNGPAMSTSNMSICGSARPADCPLPKFDRSAYGDPSRRSAQSGNASVLEEQRQPSASAPRHGQQERPTTSESNVSTSMYDDRMGPQISAPPPTAHQISPHQAVNDPLQMSKSTMRAAPQATMESQRSSRRVPSSQVCAAGEVTSKPRIQTFESLKQGSETPEQMIARLQEAGVREVSQRNRRKDQGEIPVTTALSTLDFLRKPLPSSAMEHQPPTANSWPQALTPRDPNTPLHQALRGNLGPTNSDFIEAKVERKEKHAWEKQAQNPSLWQETGEESNNNGDWERANNHQESDNSERPPTECVEQTDQNISTWRTGVPIPNGQNVDVSLEASFWSGQPGQRVAQLRGPAQAPSRGRWAVTADMKATPARPDSNAEGSEESESDADSTRPMVKGFGRLIRSRQPLVREEQLVGWDGKIQPPPVDWEQRAQFHNNTPEYISGFEGWLGEITVQTVSEKSAPEINFGVIPPEEVVNLDNHADGIGFAARDTVLDPSNAERYGHRLAAAPKLGPHNPADFEGDAKLDLADPDSRRYKDETAEFFISQYMAHQSHTKREAEITKQVQEAEKERAAAVLAEAKAAEAQQLTQPLTPVTTKNIYLRPAVETDAPGMMEILNWHINNGVRPSELREVTEEDMIQRMQMAQNARLPFIVAVERTRRTSRTHSRKYPLVNPNHPIQNIDPNYIGVTRDEPIVGFASATDWAASDYIETITAELELYVAAAHRKSGVGHCLMDGILEATDRGYMKKGGYEFRVAPEIKHMYTVGGGRDLHKLVFQIRCFNNAMTPEQTERIRRAVMGTPDPPLNSTAARRIGDESSNKKDFSKSARLDDREDDYETWLKEWLESYGFEEEAHLKKLGTKRARFVDVRYMTRETCWQPAEHRIPDYTNGL